MTNIQSVSSKLQPVNKANNENNAIASFNKKEYFPRLAFGKENIVTSGKQSESTKVAFGNYRFLSPDKYRARKASDSIIYHPKQSHDIPVTNKIRDLINHWESKENLPKRHLSENGDSSSSHKFVEEDVFPKPDFKIYTSDEKQGEASCSKGRTCIPKCEKHFRKANISSVTTIDKKNKLIKLHQTQNKTEKLKLQNPRMQNLLLTDTNTENSVTPEDALSVPFKLNKIKVHHKTGNLNEKFQQISSDNLPADLLYNLEYMEDFMALQLALERSHQLSAEFLKKGINRNQRRTVVSFLIRVTAYCSYPSFILYQTIRIFDSMLDSKQVDVDQLQLIGLTALWITLKRLHTVSNIPTAAEILSFIKGEYKEKELFKCEMNIMMSLNCQISYIDPFSILAYYFININNPFIQVNRTDLIYYCASYMIDVSLLSSSFCKNSTIVLIAAAAELALFIVLAKEEDLQNPDWQFWRACLPKVFWDKKEVKEAEIEKTRKILIKLALLTNGSEKDYVAVYKKYKRSRYGHISEIVIARLLKVSQDES